MEDLASNIGQYAMYATSAIGAAAVILQGLDKVAKITPNKVDDHYIAKANGVVRFLVKVLDRLSLQLPADKSRQK